jgi:uncharacterized protein (DUF697 family)
VKIALVGRAESGVERLAEEMRRDPARPGAQTQAPLLLADLDTARQMADKIAGADLVILLSPSSSAASADSAERLLARGWADAGARVLVFVNLAMGEGGASKAANGSNGSAGANDSLALNTLDTWIDWDPRRLVSGRVDDTDFLLRTFVPAVLNLLPDLHLPLGRYFPLFRVSIANRLINETCFSNAAYALSTGLAEIVPVLDIPLNVTDMIVLSKNQAFLVYKLGLGLGMSTRWQDYVTEFGSVLGGGFLWRQLARGLVGLIPAWGILPKIAVAYSGTYVVGHVVLQWYLTGRHVNPRQMRQLYSQAFARGRRLARELLDRVPRPRLARGRKPAALPAPQAFQVCAACGRPSAVDAQFCQYCGESFGERPQV